jgi:hypothetical protein
VPDERPARLPELLNGLPGRLLHAHPVHGKGRPRGMRTRDFIAASHAISLMWGGPLSICCGDG